MAAAPAPEQTILISSMRLPTTANPFSSAAAGNDGRAVLVVVKDRDLHASAQACLDQEALGRLDVLEVDAAEGRLQAGDNFHQLVGVGLV